MVALSRNLAPKHAMEMLLLGDGAAGFSLMRLGLVNRVVGVLRALAEARALHRAAMEEVAALARARGVALGDDAVARTQAFLDGVPAEGTASMQRDIGSGRPSELEDQVGAVARLGRAAGVPTPIHDVLYAVLLPQEAAARGKVRKFPRT
jgi:2-dehydropantoate 2-reductase